MDVTGKTFLNCPPKWTNQTLDLYTDKRWNPCFSPTRTVEFQNHFVPAQKISRQFAIMALILAVGSKIKIYFRS